eukprot:3336247-Rhodomonas_salina.2
MPRLLLAMQRVPAAARFIVPSVRRVTWQGMGQMERVGACMASWGCSYIWRGYLDLGCTTTLFEPTLRSARVEPEAETHLPVTKPNSVVTVTRAQHSACACDARLYTSSTGAAETTTHGCSQTHTWIQNRAVRALKLTAL